MLFKIPQKAPKPKNEKIPYYIRLRPEDSRKLRGLAYASDEDIAPTGLATLLLERAIRHAFEDYMMEQNRNVSSTS